MRFASTIVHNIWTQIPYVETMADFLDLKTHVRAAERRNSHFLFSDGLFSDGAAN
jgi:hypothetical protein